MKAPNRKLEALVEGPSGCRRLILGSCDSRCVLQRALRCPVRSLMPFTLRGRSPRTREPNNETDLEATDCLPRQDDLCSYDDMASQMAWGQTMMIE